MNNYLNQSELNEDLYPIVKEICDQVKFRGDDALKEYNLKLDKVETSQLSVSKEDLFTAYQRIDSSIREALEQSHDRIKAYQLSIKQDHQQDNSECYEIYHPLERVGVYVPGGKASYPSTVLMTVRLSISPSSTVTAVSMPPASTIVAESQVDEKEVEKGFAVNVEGRKWKDNDCESLFCY